MNEEYTVSSLTNDIKLLIATAKNAAVSYVNTTLTLLYWHIGKRLVDEGLKDDRNAYGKGTVESIASALTLEYGQGFAVKNLRRMIQFADLFPDEQIVVTLSRQLSWSHFVSIIPIKDPLSRDFYAEMCKLESWSVRQLRKSIDSMLFERVAISKQPETMIRKEFDLVKTGEISPGFVMKDPYFLDFLGLKQAYSENDLEMAILREMEAFLLELGAGFTFVARQKRMIIDGEDFHLDLLFYHRKLHRLIAIELKLGKFKAAYKGQMELYLRWLDKYERAHQEESPLGIILCAVKGKETVDLLELGESGIHVAEYFTELPSKDILVAKLDRSIKEAREKYNIPLIEDKQA
ncbi:MAG: PDDEXK nuclease domain-containing protein [Candidatus Cloacimonetes bacterium]|nr:PDDEXK nuclease domain-containing protein [Candidatus Cloacimonadota bacterium]